MATVKLRFKALREKYRRETVIEEKCRRSGAPANSRPTWPLMSFFKFMNSQEENRDTTSNYASIDEVQEFSFVDEYENDVVIVDHDYDGHVDEELELSRASTSVTPCRKKRKLADSPGDALLVDVSNALKSITQKPKVTKFDQFAQYLGAELNEMTEENANLLMEDINMLLIEFKRRCRSDK